jgi:hypothetical protein
VKPACQADYSSPFAQVNAYLQVSIELGPIIFLRRNLHIITARCCTIELFHQGSASSRKIRIEDTDGKIQ